MADEPRIAVVGAAGSRFGKVAGFNPFGDSWRIAASYSASHPPVSVRVLRLSRVDSGPAQRPLRLWCCLARPLDGLISALGQIDSTVDGNTERYSLSASQQHRTRRIAGTQWPGNYSCPHPLRTSDAHRQLTRNILAKQNIERLRALAGSGALLAFDFDGTLAPLGSDSFATRMRAESTELLRSLAHAAPVAVISGRSVHDLTPRLDGIPMLAVVGNHGAEPSRFAKRAAREVAGWMPQLRALVARLEGVVIEDKLQSVSVHYWHAPEPAAAIAALETLVPQLTHAVRVVRGIGIVNLVPRGAPDKGDALLTLVKSHGLPGALFVGDELTDENAFRRLTSDRDLGVRVGRSKDTSATYHIATQLDVDALLTELLIGRTRPRRSPATDGSAPAAPGAYDGGT